MGIAVSVENGLQRQAGYWTIIPPTMGEVTISALKEVWRRFPSASLYKFKQQVKRLSKGLSGTIEEPCWAGLGIDPSVFIKQDILHGLHKFIWDHPGEWPKKLIGENEMDHHFIVQPPIHTSALLVVFRKSARHLDRNTALIRG